MGYTHTDRGSIAITASDTQLAVNDPECDVTSIKTYESVATIRVTYPVNPNSVLRVKFSLIGDGANFTYGKVYKNGTAVGVEKKTLGIVFADQSDDITFTDLNQNDIIQLYAKTDAGSSDGRVKEFRICGTPVFTPFESVF